MSVVSPLMIKPSFLFALLGLAPSISAQKSLSGIPQATARVQAWAKIAQVPFPIVSPEIHVYKKAHRLELWSSGKRIKAYKVGLGHRGLADKVRSGDHLTPEGTYYVCTKNSASAYHLFLGISYPNPPAADRGLKTGLINKSQHQQILSANQRQQCPPWNTALGGTVGIHGHGSNSDWTWGCVALEDWDVDELWVSCPVGTPIFIKP